LRLGQILQPVLAEVAERNLGEKIARRPRDEHVSAVPRRHYPRATVQVDADIPLLRLRRLAGVDPHSHRYQRLR
jgi:hypothetical protein